MSFGSRLRLLREERNITQKQLGSIIGVSPRMVSFYESGAHFPRDEKILHQLADYFEVSTDFLLDYSEIRTEASLKAFCAEFKNLPFAAQQNLAEYMHFLSYKSKKTRTSATTSAATQDFKRTVRSKGKTRL